MRLVKLEKSPIGSYVAKSKKAGIPKSEICERVRAHVRKLRDRKERSLMEHLYYSTSNCLSYYGLYNQNPGP